MTKYEFLSELANLFDKYIKDNSEYENVQQKFEHIGADGKKIQAGVSTYKFL